MGSRAYTIQKDLRTDLSGASVGQVASPGSTIANPGAIALGGGDYSKLSLSIAGGYQSGLSGADVKGLMEQQGTLADSAINRVTDFAQASISAIGANKATEISAAAGEPTWQRYIPHLIIAGVVVAIWRRSRS
jgi:hypothetical protein